MREFYLRDDNDPNYIPDILETSNEMEALVYQIRMTIGTSSGEVLGETLFGADPEDMLFATNYNIDAWNNKLLEQLKKYSMVAREHNLEVNTVTMTDGYKDVGILDIKINGKSIIGFAFDGK